MSKHRLHMIFNFVGVYFVQNLGTRALNEWGKKGTSTSTGNLDQVQIACQTQV